MPAPQEPAGHPAPVNPLGVLKPEVWDEDPSPPHWAYEAWKYVRQNGLIQGYP